MEAPRTFKKGFLMSNHPRSRTGLPPTPPAASAQATPPTPPTQETPSGLELGGVALARATRTQVMDLSDHSVRVFPDRDVVVQVTQWVLNQVEAGTIVLSPVK